MFDSMMHSPVTVVILAILLLVIVSALFVAVRVAGSRHQRDDVSSSHPDPTNRGRE